MKLAVLLGSVAMMAAPAWAGQYPSYIRSHYPKAIQPLLLKESALDDRCRGTGQNNQKFCDERDAVSRAIEKAGWCWGPDDAIEADRTWMRCGPRAHPDI